MKNSEVEIAKDNALKAVNGFILQHKKEEIDEYDFSCIVNIINAGYSADHYGSPRVAAVKYLRKVTSSVIPIKWSLSYKDADHSRFVAYIEEDDLQETGVMKEDGGLGLKEALDVVKFIEANLAYLTYED